MAKVFGVEHIIAQTDTIILYNEFEKIIAGG